MKHFNLRLPDHLYDQIKAYAERNGTSVNQFILVAVAKEVGLQEAEEFFQSRISNAAGQENILRLLNKAPEVEPENPDDRLD